MPLSRFSFALAVLCASSYASTAAAAPTLYKCVTNGQVTYANEPCKGQSMQVVKGGDANMVQVNSQKNMAPNDPSGADVPVVKLEPKTDTSTGPTFACFRSRVTPGISPVILFEERVTSPIPLIVKMASFAWS